MPRHTRFALPALAVLIATGLAVADAHAAAAAAPQHARRLMEAGHFRQARAMLETEKSARPDDPAVLSALAEAHMAFGDMDAAEKLAKRAVELAPTDAQAHETLADVLGRRAGSSGGLKALGYAGRFRKAAEKALELDPSRIGPRISLMEFHLQAPGIAGGDKKKARAYAEEIARLDASRGELAFARVESAAGDTNRLEARYRAAVEKDPSSIDARMTLARWAATPHRAQWALAEEQTRAAIRLAPDRSGPYTLLAMMYAHRGMLTELDAVLAAADAACAGDLGAWYQAGRVLLGEGKALDRAERCFRRYLEVEAEGGNPRHAHARWRLALVLEKQGRRAEALAELESAVAALPDFDPAKKDLKRLRK